MQISANFAVAESVALPVLVVGTEGGNSRHDCLTSGQFPVDLRCQPPSLRHHMIATYRLKSHPAYRICALISLETSMPPSCLVSW